MKTNHAALALIMRWETLQIRAYLCPAGVPTIGYGHTGDVTKADVLTKRTITEHQAEIMLQLDVEFAERSVDRMTKGVKLNENQYGALVSWIFNCGDNKATQGSTLLHLVNDGKFTQAADQFGKWVKGRVKGELVTLPGLVKRRAQERELFKALVVSA